MLTAKLRYRQAQQKARMMGMRQCRLMLEGKQDFAPCWGDLERQFIIDEIRKAFEDGKQFASLAPSPSPEIERLRSICNGSVWEDNERLRAHLASARKALEKVRKLDWAIDPGLLSLRQEVDAALTDDYREPQTLCETIAKVYGELDAEDCKRIDREWARQRGYVLPDDGTSTLTSTHGKS